MNWFGSALEELVDMVDSIGLQDSLLVGSEFTFFEGGMGDARSRLDRFLIRDGDSGWSNDVGFYIKAVDVVFITEPSNVVTHVCIYIGRNVKLVQYVYINVKITS